MLAKKSKRWLARIISSLILSSFTSFEILPPAWAGPTPLEEPIQNYIPETSPVQIQERSTEEILPNTSTDFLQGSSPLSPPEDGSDSILAEAVTVEATPVADPTPPPVRPPKIVREYSADGAMGTLTREFIENYHPNGRVSLTTDVRYQNGVLSSSFSQVFDTNGHLIAKRFAGYDPNGRIRSSYFILYQNDGTIISWANSYDTEGVIQTYQLFDHYPTGKVNTSDDYRYTNGLKTVHIHQSYDSTGSRTHFLIESYDTNGTLQSSDNYDYNSGKLTKRILNEYDSRGVLSNSITTNFPQTIQSSDESYLLTYAVDGIEYQEKVILTQGENLIQRQVQGYGGIQVTVEFKITLLPIQSALSFLPIESILPAHDARFVPFKWVETTTEVFTEFGETKYSGWFSFIKRLNLPFSFTFFDETYTTIWISSNGFVQFGESYHNASIPPDSIPNLSSSGAIAAPLWRDLKLFQSEGGTITYSQSPTQFVVSWDSVPNYHDSIPQRFQLILESNGSITFQYQTVTDDPNTVIGLEDSASTRGMSYTLLPNNGTAIKFIPFFSGGSVLINQGASSTSSREVTLAVQGSSPNADLESMRFSMDQGKTWTEWEAFQTTKTLTLPSGNGTKEVQCQLKDQAGFTSTIFSGTITLDTVGPIGSIAINNGLTYMNSTFVSLSLAVTDVSGMSQMRFSTDGGTSWSDWEIFQTMKTLRLTEGGGVKEVRGQFRDNAGNVSTFTDSIILDPTVSLFQDQNLRTNEGVRKVIVLGPLLNQEGNLITYSYQASENLVANGQFILFENQLTYTPNSGFIGSGTITVQAIDELEIRETIINLEVKAPQLNVPNDPYFGLQWGLDKVRAVRAWNLSRGSGVNIAIIDSGIDMSHPDLNDNIFRNWNEIPNDGIDNDANGFIDDVQGWDFVNQDNDPSDDIWHGTHVAGIVAAESNNGEGVSGIAPDAKLIPIKVVPTSRMVNFDDVVRAIRYAVAIGAKVINMSLGRFLGILVSEIPAGGFVQGLRDAIREARQNGVVVVASAGNHLYVAQGDTGQVVPAALEGVITVAATDRLDDRAWTSNFGDELEVAAPGVDILSTIPTQLNSVPDSCFSEASIYWCERGTSMAAPFVSGLAAMILSQDPLATDLDIIRRLRFSSLNLGTVGFDPYYGYGRIDAFQALSYDYYEDGTIKTQWLETPDEHGFLRLNFDTVGRLIGGSPANPLI